MKNINWMYFPCIRWKMGEYQAISKLSEHTKNLLLPIIEVAEFGSGQEFDFETRKKPKSLDKHLELFISRIGKIWKNDCIIDLQYIPNLEILSDGTSVIDYVFTELKNEKVQFIPTIRIDDPTEFTVKIKKYVSTDTGVSIRISLDQFTDENLEFTIQNKLDEFGLTIKNCYLIVDLMHMNFEPIERLADILFRIISDKKYFLNSCKKLVIIGTAFPQSISKIEYGISFLPRHEWSLFKLLCKKFYDKEIVLPQFGDYTISNPALIQVDMRIVKSFANVRYTVEDKWLVVKGKNVRDYKFEQFRELCSLIITSGYYYGKNFSFGDAFISNCANGTGKIGNLSTWKQIGTNHHIETIVKDLSNLFDS